MNRESEIYRNACAVLRKLSTYDLGFGTAEIFLRPETSTDGTKGILFQRIPIPGSGWERTYIKFVPESDLGNWAGSAGHMHQKATEITERTQAGWEAIAECLTDDGDTP